MLLDWLEEAQLDRVGCFKYEPVEGATANDLGLPQVPDEVKEERWNRFMEAQQVISARRLQSRVGSDQGHHRRSRSTVVEGPLAWDAPEIDGTVYIASRRPVRAGDIVTVKIERADAYDLHGRSSDPQGSGLRLQVVVTPELAVDGKHHRRQGLPRRAASPWTRTARAGRNADRRGLLRDWRRWCSSSRADRAVAANKLTVARR